MGTSSIATDADGRSKRERGRLALLCAAAVGCLASARAEEGPARSFSGRLSLDYVPRWQGGAGYDDHDIYGNLLVEWGEQPGRFSGSVYWRGVKDVDGIAVSPDDPFYSVYDTYEGGWHSRLFHAYLDVGDEAADVTAKLGRQFLYEGQPFHFDGAKLDTRAWPAGLRASLFGGVPVHYFEDSRAGDWLAGLGLEVRPWRGGRVGLLYAHVEDDGGFAGLPATGEVDDMLLLSASGRLGGWGAAAVRYTAVDARTRDLVARLKGSYERGDLTFALSYYLQPETLTGLSTDLSTYYLAMGESYPFQKLDLTATKGFSARDRGFELEGRWTTRRLLYPSDEGEYNREYDVLRVGLGARSKPRRLSAGVGMAWWSSSGDRFDALDAEVRYEPSKALRLSLGTSYSLYRYDILSLSEETDVRETYLKVKWKSSGRSELRLEYAAEQADADLVHTVRSGWCMRF